MELQFLHQGRKIYSWTYAPLNIMYIIFFTKVVNAPFPFRGRYSVEIHQSFLRLQGQANDFKIQYSSILRLFVLPKVTLFWFFYLCVVSSYCMAHSLLPLLCHCWLQSNRVISFCHICSHKILILLWLSHLIHQFEKDKHCIPTLLFRCCITIQFSH